MGGCWLPGPGKVAGPAGLLIPGGGGGPLSFSCGGKKGEEAGPAMLGGRGGPLRGLMVSD